MQDHDVLQFRGVLRGQMPVFCTNIVILDGEMYAVPSVHEIDLVHDGIQAGLFCPVFVVKKIGWSVFDTAYVP